MEKIVSSYVKYINKIVGLLLDPEDIIKYNTAKSILYSNKELYNIMTYNLSEQSAVRMLQLIMNCAIISFRYIVIPDYTYYFITSLPGLKKIYYTIFQNPIYGALFYCTFYFEILTITDKEVFNKIAKTLKISEHDDAIGTVFLDKIMNFSKQYNLPEFLGNKEKQLERLRVIAGVITGSILKKTLDVSLSLFKNSVEEMNFSDLEDRAVYFSEAESFDYDDSEIQDQLNFIKENTPTIKKTIKNMGISLKKKKRKKLALQQIFELKTEDEKTVCLDRCEQKIKTNSGCYCESPCGKTAFFTKKEWCYVDPLKCKKRKLLSRMGKVESLGIPGFSYDYCSSNKKTKNKLCYTGVDYKECEII